MYLLSIAILCILSLNLLSLDTICFSSGKISSGKIISYKDSKITYQKSNSNTVEVDISDIKEIKFSSRAEQSQSNTHNSIKTTSKPDIDINNIKKKINQSRDRIFILDGWVRDLSGKAIQLPEPYRNNVFKKYGEYTIVDNEIMILNQSNCNYRDAYEYKKEIQGKIKNMEKEMSDLCKEWNRNIRALHNEYNRDSEQEEFTKKQEALQGQIDNYRTMISSL